MIYVTVGTQLPFDRLIRAVDTWAQANARCEVFGQIGNAGFEPYNITWKRFLTPQESDQCIRDARVIVSHAGMGTIISALERGKPIIVFPRRAALGEQRNDHQLATARRFGERGLVQVADGEEALACALDQLDALVNRRHMGPHASTRLVSFLSDFLHEG